jgi:hypothetical protein
MAQLSHNFLFYCINRSIATIVGLVDSTLTILIYSMATNWLSYYRFHRQDGSSVQQLYSTEQDVLAEVAKASLN